MASEISPDDQHLRAEPNIVFLEKRAAAASSQLESHLDLQQDPAASSPGESGPSGVDQSSRPHKIGKIRTEAANPFLQFVRVKKSSEKALNPDSKLDMTSVRQEWSRMKDTEKEVYKEMYVKEKSSMGSSYRNKNDRAAKRKEISIKSKLKPKARKKRKMTRPKESNKDNNDNDKSLMDLMKRYKDKEIKIKAAENSIAMLHKEVLVVSVGVAVNKTKFQNLTENVKGLKEKLSNVKKLHKDCII